MPEVNDPVERWLYGGALLGLIAGAWVAMGLLGVSAYAPYFSHAFVGGDAPWPLGRRVAIFVAGWTLMSVAMMLPSSLPLVTGFHTMTRRGSLVSLLIAGYLCVWALFGAVAFLADAGIHAVLEATPGINARADLIPPSLLLAAGLFQFSPSSMLASNSAAHRSASSSSTGVVDDAPCGPSASGPGTECSVSAAAGG